MLVRLKPLVEITTSEGDVLSPEKVYEKEVSYVRDMAVQIAVKAGHFTVMTQEEKDAIIKELGRTDGIPLLKVEEKSTEEKPEEPSSEEEVKEEVKEKTNEETLKSEKEETETKSLFSKRQRRRGK